MVNDFLVSVGLAVGVIAVFYMMFIFATLMDLAVRVFSKGKQGIIYDLPEKKV
jgi:hypothetical protein